MKKIKYILIFFLLLAPTQAVFSQEIVDDKLETFKAKVTEIISERKEEIPGTDTLHTIQKLKVEVISGKEAGTSIELNNDFLKLEQGEVFYIKKLTPWDGGKPLYSVSEPYRTPSLLFLGGLFIFLTIIFGGKQGIRGLLSLAGSFALIGFVLLPAIAKGYSPVLVSIGVSSLIIVLGSYITHGFNKTTSSAVIGMIITISFIGAFALYSIDSARLTGFETDEAMYLNFNTQGAIDLPGLLLGGILIGLLGVMYDAAIGQAIAVEELHRVAPHMSRRAIYKRGIRIGREHIGALVNTLAIAYVGASLPLLLLFYYSSESASVIANREIFATEIVRSLIGSIGLILAVPFTTLISTWMIVKKSGSDADESLIKKEMEAVEHVGHHH